MRRALRYSTASVPNHEAIPEDDLETGRTGQRKYAERRKTRHVTSKTKFKVLRVSYIRDGKKQHVDVEVPDTGESDEVLLEDAAKFVQTLEDNKQVAYGPGPLPPGTTHQIETRPDGTRRLTRRRFSVA